MVLDTGLEEHPILSIKLQNIHHTFAERLYKLKDTVYNLHFQFAKWGDDLPQEKQKALLQIYGYNAFLSPVATRQEASRHKRQQVTFDHIDFK